MRRLFILIMGAMFLATSALAVAAENPTPFNPKIHNGENLPAGILYMESGTIYYVDDERLVVGDANYPLNSKVKVFTQEGLKITRKNLKTGQEADLYANDKHEAVYIVLK